MYDQDEARLLFAPGTSLSKPQIDHILGSETMSAKLSAEEAQILRTLQQQFASQGIEYVHLTLAPEATVLEGLQELSRVLDDLVQGRTRPYTEPDTLSGL